MYFISGGNNAESPYTFDFSKQWTINISSTAINLVGAIVSRYYSQQYVNNNIRFIRVMFEQVYEILNLNAPDLYFDVNITGGMSNGAATPGPLPSGATLKSSASVELGVEEDRLIIRN